MIPVLRPLLPPASALLPYLEAIDARRVYSNSGPLNRLFALELEACFNLPRHSAAPAASGTAALTGALLSASAVSGRRRAAMPSLTFAATAIAAQRAGLEPLVLDVDEESWMLDPERLADHPRIGEVAVAIPVAPYGRPVPQEPWLRFSRRTGIPVVIDGAACFATARTDPAAFFGPVPVALSFHATKSFGIGEGGCLICTDPGIVVDVASSLNFGFFGTRESVAPSLNGKLSEYHAAVGLAALERWPERRRALGRVADLYRDAFAHEPGVRLHAAPAVDGCYTLLECLDGPHVATSVERSLAEAQVDTRFWYGRGLAHHRHFAGMAGEATPVADAIASRLLGMPSSHDLVASEIELIAAAAHQGLAPAAATLAVGA